MTLSVGSNTYATLAEYKAWATLRGYVTTATDAQIESALIISSIDFIDAMHTFKGVVVSEDQLMKLPTDEVTIADIVPAAMAAAKMHLEGLLFVDLSLISHTGTIESETKSIGSLSKSITYSANTSQSSRRLTPVINALLRPFLLTSSQSVYRI